MEELSAGSPPVCRRCWPVSPWPMRRRRPTRLRTRRWSSGRASCSPRCRSSTATTISRGSTASGSRTTWTRSTCGRAPRKLDPPMHTDIPRLRQGGLGRPVLVGLHPGRDHRRGRHPGDAGADRRRPPAGRALSRHLRAGADGGRRGAHPQGRADRLADRHGGGAFDRRLARRPAPALRRGRPLHDAHPHQEHRLGRLGDRRAPARRPHPLRRGGGARDEPARHAGRSLARRAGDDEEGDRRLGGAGDLLPLLGPGPGRPSAQRAGRRAPPAAEERRRGDGDLRPLLRLGGGARLERR